MKTDKNYNKSNRLADGRFMPGISGNPQGRPKEENIALRKLLSAKGEAVVNTLIEAALSGDIQACKIVLDRICPTLKAQAPTVVLDKPLPISISETARVFIDAAANGQISPDTTVQLVNSVGVLARVIEVDELKERLESLERSIIKSTS